jgi:2-polyprenyl-3-methyl-5-hydroxy-6-metoxy-1,4-benzoquinol methylase
VADCCDPEDCRAVFSERFARRTATRYRRRGLTPAAERIVRFATDNDIRGASVLEIGGGVGHVHVELLRRGAARATNLELSPEYEAEAARLLASTGMADRVDRRFLDIAAEPEEAEPADIVVLHRVVCCYPDHERLLSAAARHARRLLVFSYPPASRLNRTFNWSDNALRRIRGNGFRTYIHPPDSMIAVAAADGMRATYREHSRAWDVVGLVR